MGEPLIRAQTADVRLVRVKRSRQDVEESEGAQHTEEVLDGDTPVTLLEAPKSFAVDARSISQLGLCQAP